MKLQISRFERTSPRNLKYQPTNVWKDHTKSLGIDTGKDEQQLITANPISREVLLEIAGVHQWLEIKRDFSFWWLMKEAVSCTLKIAYKEKYLMKIRELNKIQQDIRGNVNNIINKQTITNACNAIHV